MSLLLVSTLLGSHVLPLAYLLWDGRRRQAPGLLFWVVVGGVLGAFVLPWYWAARPLQRGEVRKGGFVAMVVKGHFWLWTLFMGGGALFMISAQPFSPSLGVGLLVLLGIWGAPLYLCRKALWLLLPRTVERGPTGPLAERETKGRRR